LENEINTIRKQTNERTNTEHGGQKLRMRRGYLCTQANGSSFIDEIRRVQKMF